MIPPPGRAYSTKRLRLVVVFLTLATLPLVVGAAFLIYEYMRASVIVERRLKSERWMVPSRLYTRPLALRPGLVLGPDTLVRILNGLKYEQKSDLPPAPGEFVVREGVIVLTPRPNPDAAGEPVAVAFEKGRLKEMRGLQTKKPYPRQVLEPALLHVRGELRHLVLALGQDAAHEDAAHGGAGGQQALRVDEGGGGHDVGVLLHRGGEGAPVRDARLAAEDLDVRRGAEDARADLLLEAVHHRHHGDQGRDAERDAEHRDQRDE